MVSVVVAAELQFACVKRIFVYCMQDFKNKCKHQYPPFSCFGNYSSYPTKIRTGYQLDLKILYSLWKFNLQDVNGSLNVKLIVIEHLIESKFLVRNEKYSLFYSLLIFSNYKKYESKVWWRKLFGYIFNRPGVAKAVL